MNRLFLMPLAMLSIYSGTQAAADDPILSRFYGKARKKAIEIKKRLDTLSPEELTAMLNSNVERMNCHTPPREERGELHARNCEISRTFVITPFSLEQHEIELLSAEIASNLARLNLHSVPKREQSTLTMTNMLITLKLDEFKKQQEQ